ncbi:MAG TPA: hypothetical protein VKU92_12015 [Acidimicrobiales bacterium]|nr:hypothetical protein [Acidimicrobiales bacterium]
MGIFALVVLLAGIVLVAAALVGRAEAARRRRLAEIDGVAKPERRARPFGAFEWVVFGVSAVYVLWTVLSSPVKGLANQGDYERLTVQLGVAPVASQPYSAYALTYKYHLHQSLAALGLSASVAGNANNYSYYFGYHSSTLVMARLAIGLHGLLGGGSTFDIRWLGLLNALVWLGALASLFVAARQLPARARGAAEILLAIAFTDFGYVQYFNSFFSEPTEIGFTLLAIGLAACTATSRRPLLPFAGFVAASAMAVSAKTEDAVIAVVFTLLALVLAWRHLRPRREWRVAGALGALTIAGFGLWDWTSQVPYLKAYQLYDSVFDGILRSGNPKAALASLGLPQSLARYAGFATADARSAFAKPFIQTEFFDRIGVGKIVSFYLAHPGNLITILSKNANRDLLLRPPYANLPAGAGSGLRQYATDSPWTLVHQSILPHALWFVALVLLVGLATAVVAWRRAPRATSPEVLAATVLTAGLVFVQAPVGGGLDGVVKHGVLFDSLLDLTMIVVGTLLVERLWRRFGASPVAAGALPLDGEVELGAEDEHLASADDVDHDMSAVGGRRGEPELADRDGRAAGVVEGGHGGAEGL